MSLGPVTLVDTFSRTVSGGWGTMDSGQAWSSGNSSYNVNGANGTYDVVANAAARSLFVNLSAYDIPDQQSVEVLTMIRATSSTTYPATDFGPVINRVGSGDLYFSGLQISYGEIYIGCFVGGVRYELNRTALSLSKNTWYWVRFRRDTRLRLRVWPMDTAEPTSWTLETNTFDGANPPGVGDVGMYTHGLTDSHQVQVSNFHMYTLEDEYPALPVRDTFERTVVAGFGYSDSGHIWEGNFAYDPAVTVSARLGNVTDPGDGYANFDHPDTTTYIGMIGQSLTGNQEALIKVSTNTGNGNTWMDIGLCGSMDAPSGVTRYAGYVVRFQSNATTIAIHKRSALGNSLGVQATSAALGFTITANTIYWLRFQKSGSTVQARIWADGGAEPGTWNVTFADGTPLSGGRGFVSMVQNVAATKNLRIYDYTFGVPTPATTTYTGTGALTSTAITDTSLALRSAFTNDSNANNSIVVEYQKTTDTTWTTFGGTKTRVASPLSYTFTITGLTKTTAYRVRVTYTDADNVSGTNPVVATFTTTSTTLDTGTTSITAIGTTTATVESTYSGDSNTNSTATIDYRVAASAQKYAWDGMDGNNYQLLVEHTPDPIVSGQWIRHLSSSDRHMILDGQSHAYANNMAVNDKLIYYHTGTQPSPDYGVNGWFLYRGVDGTRSVAGRMSSALNTMYLCQMDTVNNLWKLIKVVDGVETLLASSAATFVLNHTYKIFFSISDAAKTMFADSVQVATSADNAITSAGYGGVVWTNSTGTTAPTVQTVLAHFDVQKGISAGAFTGSAAATADRVNKKFTRAITGLSIDTTYEFRTTYADADGVGGTNPISVVGITQGAAVSLASVVASAQQTTAVVLSTYTFDSNSNSTITLAYRNNMDRLWTTAPASATTVNRGTKTFTTLLSSLRSNASYEAKVTISDPDGIISSGTVVLTALFTTSGYVSETVEQDKHFLWKVYDVSNTYVTTWRDAPIPQFSFDENGGVSDLTVVLNRPISDIDNPKSGIKFQNRVDIVAVDPSSDGMGLNMVEDSEFTLGSWTLGANASISSKGGPDDSSCLKLSATGSQVITRSSPILLRNEESIIDSGQDAQPVPVVLKALAKASGSKLTMYVEAYDINDVKIEESSSIAETVGSGWQQLRLEYLPMAGTAYLRVAIKNDAAGTMYADKVEMRAKEYLIYRGRIETYTPKIDQDSQTIELQVLGLVSLLNDDYIDFLQFVITQPHNDQINARENLGPMDPANMLRITLDQAKKQNPSFALYYTSDSIHDVGYSMQYTFRGQQIRSMVDKIRSLAPPDWHYFIEPDGLVTFRGPQHGKTHTLRRGVEIMNISIENSIRNLKNYIQVKGRQDEDNSEPDGNGSIYYVAFDQASIDKYGRRVLHIQDSNITDPDTAETVANGRLEENNHEEQRVQCQVQDEKSIVYTGRALKGYNIEEFRPGDQVIILDPVSGPRVTYWDAFDWNVGMWDFENVFTPLPNPVPIKTVQYQGSFVRLELSERQPSSVSDFGRLYRWLATKDAEQGDS
jgi:hypothetical protein